MSASLPNRHPFRKVVVIGAGFSGLAMGIQLKKKLKCDDFVIYDRATGAGGTWWANRYPGCGVDVPAVFYSLSFAPNPRFSKVFPKQAEILQYFNDVSMKYDIARHIVCSVQWEGASWQEMTGTWLVKLRDLSTGQWFEQECKVLISAVGGLSMPNSFNIPGIETFMGDIVHTAQWNSDLSIQNKDVVVIGNGSSASQLIPAIVDEARSITQFMRTPQHYMPSQNISINRYLRTIFGWIPAVHYFLRTLVFLYLETSGLQFNLTQTGASLRKAAFEKSEKYIKETAPEKYWRLLIPTYSLGCKRRVFDNDHYVACLHRENIHLTDDPIVALQARSVLTESGKTYPADTILLATGFSLTQFNVKLYGRHGISREGHWEALGSKTAFKTVAMAGFPNFFYILGPHSGRGHTSTLLAAESFVNLIIRAIKPIIDERAKSVDINYLSERLYHQRIMAALDNTVFTKGCGSWYIDRQTETNWFIYPWSSFTMWYSTHVSAMSDWSYEFHSDRRGIYHMTKSGVSLFTGTVLLFLIYKTLLLVFNVSWH